MNSIRAVIVDDEKPGALTLNNLILEYCPGVEIEGVVHSKDEAAELIAQTNPNLIFLDIEMPHGSGFDLLRTLSKRDFEVIFTTGYSDYALQAIKAHAIDYLLKPIDIKELIASVERAKIKIKESADSSRLNQLLNRLNKATQTRGKIAVATSDGVELLEIDGIIRLEAERGYTWIHSIDRKKIISSKNLGEYEKTLQAANDHGGNSFVRVHHSYLVNMRYVRRVNSKMMYVEMDDGAQIDVSQRKRTYLNKLIRGLL